MLTMEGLRISVAAAVAMNLRRRALRVRCDCCAGEFADGAGPTPRSIAPPPVPAAHLQD